jgi:hypothetical protein
MGARLGKVKVRGQDWKLEVCKGFFLEIKELSKLAT